MGHLRRTPSWTRGRGNELQSCTGDGEARGPLTPAGNGALAARLATPAASGAPRGPAGGAPAGIRRGARCPPRGRCRRISTVGRQPGYDALGTDAGGRGDGCGDRVGADGASFPDWVRPHCRYGPTRRALRPGRRRLRRAGGADSRMAAVGNDDAWRVTHRTWLPAIVAEQSSRVPGAPSPPTPARRQASVGWITATTTGAGAALRRLHATAAAGGVAVELRRAARRGVRGGHGSAEGTVKSTLYDARRALRTALGEVGDD